MNKIICGIISIILILGMVACRDNNELEVENNEIIENVENGNEENKEEKNENFENTNNDENAEKLLKEYAYNTLKISEEEFNKNIIDIGRDGKPELVESIEEYPGGMRIWGVDAQNNIIEIKTIENDVDKQLMDGNYMIYETKEKESNDTVYFLTEYFADGLCYENRYVYKLKKEENTILMEQLFNYGCDSEAEEKAREEIFQKNPTEEIDNLEKELMSAHVLKYSIGKDRVSEEKFNTYIADMKERYESVRIINDYVIELNKGKITEITNHTVEELSQIRSLHIGFIRLGEEEYRLSLDKNDENLFVLRAIIDESEEEINILTLKSIEQIENVQMTIKEATLVIEIGNEQSGNVVQTIVYDENMKEIRK